MADGRVVLKKIIKRDVFRDANSLARGRSYLKLSWVAIVSIVISRLPIVNTRAFSFPRNYPSRRLLARIARIPRKWTYNLPHAHPRSPFPIVVLYHENSYGIDAGVTRTIPLRLVIPIIPYLDPSYSPATRGMRFSAAAWSQLHRKKR